MTEPLDPQKTLVRDMCARGLCSDQVSVAAGAPFRDVLKTHLSEPVCRTLSVVDTENRVQGIIPVRLLDEAVFLEVFPGSALGEIDDLESALETMREMRHQTADELMEEAQVVRMDDTVHEAFVRMHRAKVSCLPIVDDDDRVTGYLDLRALATLWDTLQEPAESA